MLRVNKSNKIKLWISNYSFNGMQLLTHWSNYMLKLGYGRINFFLNINSKMSLKNTLQKLSWLSGGGGGNDLSALPLVHAGL